MTSGKLLRVLGVAFGLAVIIGNTIGAGILRTPGSIAASLPSPWLFVGVWVLGGLYALVSSISIVELGTMIPRAGGQYAFASRALGPFAGFVVGWSDWVSTCGSTAAVSIVVGEYSGRLMPSLAGRETEIAIGVAIVFAVLQWRGVVWGGRTQEITSLIKGLGFFALIAACFLFGGRAQGGVVPPPPLMPVGAALFTALIVSLQSVVYTYDGWTGITYFSEEVDEPGRDIPRATFLGVALIIAIYVLVNVALIYVLPIGALAGKEFAAGDVVAAIAGPRGTTLVLGLVILSMLSSVNALHMMATRTIFGMSRDRLGPRVATRVNRGGTPTVALFLSALVAILFLATGTFEEVTAVLAFFFVVSYAISFTSVFVLRRREPNAHRPYRAWGYPWTTGISLLGSVAFLASALYGDWDHSKWALGLLAVSYPIYFTIKSSHPPRPKHGPRKRRKRSRK